MAETKTAVKTEPLLFRAEMVNAILAGQKTQTRRLVTARNSTVLGYPGSRYWNDLRWDYVGEVAPMGVRIDGPNDTMFGAGPGCQYLHVPADQGGEMVVYRVRPKYEVGQQIWVRETFRPILTGINAGGFDYRADDKGASGLGFMPWKPSIFMPRRASRITLEVESVRAERIQDICETDAIAEGVCLLSDPTSARDEYEILWKEINGHDSWDANPWVWAISFKVQP